MAVWWMSFYFNGEDGEFSLFYWCHTTEILVRFESQNLSWNTNVGNSSLVLTASPLFETVIVFPTLKKLYLMPT